MGIYNFCLVFIIVGILLHFVCRSKEFDRLFFVVTILLLFVIASFRGVGYDYESYHGIFLDSRIGYFDGHELGFVWLASILPSYRMLLIVMAALTFIPFYYCAKQLSPIPIYTLLLLYTTLFLPTIMGQMRQGVAVFLILTAYFIRQHRFPCVILVVTALLFHTSALIGLIYFLPLRKKYNITIYIAVFIVALFIGAYFEPLLGNFIRRFGSSLITNKYDLYYTTETLRGISIGFNSAVLIRCFVFVLSYYMLSGTLYENHKLLNLYFFSIIIYLTFGFIPQIGGRGALYFSVLDLFLIPQMIHVAKTDFKRLTLCLGFILLSVLRYIQFFSSEFNYDSYVPYIFTF